ncbi:MAG TPA: TetR/AcrR family transcriptional regulator [Candidatus Dormibacteraeota bacterium]|jgi:AcrR family transcriptional regulator|nr:TetR/AcrR family transcriptional regulator [Candidatus Dormibacteraeota bacterium]
MRDQIMEAARACVLRQGLARTSIKEIAAEAGVAPGLVHYYYRSKVDLLVAVIEESSRALLAELDRLPPDEAAAVALEEHQAGRFDDMHRLFFELIGVGLHNPKVADAIAELIRADRLYIEKIAAQLLPEMEPPALAALASVAWAGLTGIPLQRLFDPTLDSRAATGLLQQLILGAGQHFAGPPNL